MTPALPSCINDNFTNYTQFPTFLYRNFRESDEERQGELIGNVTVGGLEFVAEVGEQGSMCPGAA